MRDASTFVFIGGESQGDKSIEEEIDSTRKPIRISHSQKHTPRLGIGPQTNEVHLTQDFKT